MHSTIDRSLQYILWLPVLLPVSPLFCCYYWFSCSGSLWSQQILILCEPVQNSIDEVCLLDCMDMECFPAYTLSITTFMSICEIKSTCYMCYLLQLTTTQLQASMIAIMDMYMSSSLLQHWNISICHLMTALLRLVEELGKWPTFCGKWQVPVKDICLASVD